VTPIRVVVVDDHPMFRLGLAAALDQMDGIELVGEAERTAEVDAVVTAAGPDVVLLDIRLPPTHRDEGVRAAVALRRTHPGTGVLLLSQYVESTYATELLAAGARGVGYLLKDRVTDLAQLHDAVERIAEGGTVLDPTLVEHLLRARVDPLAALTPREREVLALMAEGRSNTAIAARLVVSNGAVEKHVTSILGKLGLESSPEAHRRVLAVLRFLDA
jgi:DNA-binding NarL/FixJ family response regulator